MNKNRKRQEGYKLELWMTDIMNDLCDAVNGLAASVGYAAYTEESQGYTEVATYLRSIKSNLVDIADYVEIYIAMLAEGDTDISDEGEENVG